MWPWTMEVSHRLSKSDFKALGSTETGWSLDWPHVSLRCHWGGAVTEAPGAGLGLAQPNSLFTEHPLACECHLYLGVLGQGLCLHVGPWTSTLEDTTPELTGLRIGFHGRIWGPSIGPPLRACSSQPPAAPLLSTVLFQNLTWKSNPGQSRTKKDLYRIGAR